MTNRSAVLGPAVIAAFALGACNDATTPEPFEKPSFSSSSKTVCNGTLPPGTYQDVIVPPGQVCTLPGVVVLGDVKAMKDSRLLSGGSDIRGNVELLGVSRVILLENLIGGDVVAQNFVAGFMAILVNEMVGSIIFKNGASEDTQICGNHILEGNIEVQNTTVTGTFAIGGGTCPGHSPNELDQGGMNVEKNTIETGGTLLVTGNRMAQDLEVSRNLGLGAKQVSGNVVGGNLRCFRNDPPFVGGPNTAGSADGDCF